MTNVYLYGELKNKFGDEFTFNINSPKEAFLAINANRKGFIDEVKKLAIQGVHYRIVMDDAVVENAKELDLQKAPREIHIVPIVWGAGKNGVLIAVGIALTIATAGAAGVFAGAGGMAAIGTTTAATATAAATTSFTALGTALMSVGIGIALQGVMGLLFPPPKPDFNQEVQAGGKSYLFGNKPSNTSQGQAVPVGYGRLKIGSSQISAGINHYLLDTDVKQLMTPVDKPISDYVDELREESVSSSAGLSLDGFSTQQAANTEDSSLYYSLNVLNSYIELSTNSADKLYSNLVEVVVKKNSDIISNPNLPTFDDNITYEWQELSNTNENGSIRFENPLKLLNGLAVRTYYPKDFKLQSEYDNLKSNQAGYFKSYGVNDLVKYGQSQFNNLRVGDWDLNYVYYTNEVVKYRTGLTPQTEIDAYFQAVANNFSNQKPTGAGATINSAYWRKVIPPNEEFLFRCSTATNGELPTGYDTPLAQPAWQLINSPTNTAGMDSLFSYYPSYEDKDQDTLNAEFKNINRQSIYNLDGNVDNYTMEFLGYFYVPTVGSDGKTFIKDVYELGTATGLYEITKIGDTGQWSGIGFTGLNGVALDPYVGATFHKNTSSTTKNGKVMQVQAYKFKLDSDDASDLYIDSKLASTYYGNHGMFSGFANPNNPTEQNIENLHSTTSTLYLTAGFHRLYARLQESRGGEGITVYYKYDTNRDDSFSNWTPIPLSKLYHSANDKTIAKSSKYSTVGTKTINAADTIKNKRYKIHTLGSASWTSIGSAINFEQGVFLRNGSSSTYTGGLVTEDFVTYSEEKSASQNRIVRFISDRPKINGEKSVGYATFKARYRCKVTLNGNYVMYSAPVKINSTFFQTSTSFRGIGEPLLPVQIQTA